MCLQSLANLALDAFDLFVGAGGGLHNQGLIGFISACVNEATASSSAINEGTK